MRLDENLLAEAKEYALRQGRTFTSVLEDSLRQLLARERRQRQSAPVSLPVFRGDGLQPGIDLADRASMNRLLEDEDIAHFRGITDADA